MSRILENKQVWILFCSKQKIQSALEKEIKSTQENQDARHYAPFLFEYSVDVSCVWPATSRCQNLIKLTFTDVV